MISKGISTFFLLLTAAASFGLAPSAHADTREPADCGAAVTELATSYLSHVDSTVSGARWRMNPALDKITLLDFEDTTPGTADQIYVARLGIESRRPDESAPRRIIAEFQLGGQGVCANLHLLNARVRAEGDDRTRE